LRRVALRCGTKDINIVTALDWHHVTFAVYNQLEMWANAQRDGPPAEYRWRPLFNAAKFADAHYCRAVTLPRRETR